MSPRRTNTIPITIILASILILTLVTSIQASPTQWIKTYGGSHWDEAFAVQQTSDGGYIVVGRTYSFGVGAGCADFWVLKLDSNGNIQWQKTYGGSDTDVACAVQQTSDGGYIVVGRTASFGAGYADFWVLKLDGDGVVSPDCSLGQDSYTSPQNTYIEDRDSYATPRTTYVAPEASQAIPRTTQATIETLCEYQPLISVSIRDPGPVPMGRSFTLEVTVLNGFDSPVTVSVALDEHTGFQAGEEYGDGDEALTLTLQPGEQRVVRFEALVYGAPRPKELAIVKVYGEDGGLLARQEAELLLTLEKMDITWVLAPNAVPPGTEFFDVSALVSFWFTYKTRVLVRLENLDTGEVVGVYDGYVENEARYAIYSFRVTREHVDLDRAGFHRFRLVAQAAFPEVDPDRVALGPFERYITVSVSESASSVPNFVIYSSLYFDITASDGRTYRAYRVCDLSRAPEAINFTWLNDPWRWYSIYNWIVLDEDGAVPDGAAYEEVALAAETALWRTSGEFHPESMRARARAWESTAEDALYLEELTDAAGELGDLLKGLTVYYVLDTPMLEGLLKELPANWQKHFKLVKDFLYEYSKLAKKLEESPIVEVLEEAEGSVRKFTTGLGVRLLLLSARLYDSANEELGPVMPGDRLPSSKLSAFRDKAKWGYAIGHAAYEHIRQIIEEWPERYWGTFVKHAIPGWTEAEAVASLVNMVLELAEKGDTKPLEFLVRIQMAKSLFDEAERALITNAHEFRERFLNSVSSSTVIKLSEAGQHKLYLHVYDPAGNHVGWNDELGLVEVGIPCSYYIDLGATTIVYIPGDVTDFTVVVDARYATEAVESYNLTIATLRGGVVASEASQSHVIKQGEEAKYSVKATVEAIEVEALPTEAPPSGGGPTAGLTMGTMAIAGALIAVAVIAAALVALKRRARY